MHAVLLSLTKGTTGNEHYIDVIEASESTLNSCTRKWPSDITSNWWVLAYQTFIISF